MEKKRAFSAELPNQHWFREELDDWIESEIILLAVDFFSSVASKGKDQQIEIT